MLQKTAFVFPGQGSQKIGMLSALAVSHPIITDTFSQASQALDYDLWELVQNGPAEKLNRTEFTQPAILTADVAAWRLCESFAPLSISYLAGHSLGEYAALVCAQSLQLPDAVKLVAARGQLMQDAVPEGEGAMAAIIGLQGDKIDVICKEAAESDILAPANFNALGQTVIAGTTKAVKRAAAIAEANGAIIAKILPVSVPAHCALMKPAAEELSSLLSEISISSPKIPVIHNVDVAVHSTPREIRELLVKQLCAPVRWVETIQFFASEQVNTIIECGPGKVLAGLNKRIIKSIPTINFTDILNQEG